MTEKIVYARTDGGERGRSSSSSRRSTRDDDAVTR
jgi:hypothetical protein